MDVLRIVNPVALASDESVAEPRFDASPRLPRIDGKTIGLFWNGKPQGDVALDRVELALAKQFPQVRLVHFLGDQGGLTRRASEGLRSRIVSEVDAIVGASADCGSCTSWLIRDLVEFERRGLPSVALVASGFVEDASWSSSVFGCPELALAEVPLPFTNRSPIQIEQMIDDAVTVIVQGLTGKTSDEALRTRPVWDHLDLVADEELSYEGAGSA